MKNLFASCHACTPPKRKPGCHSACEDYKRDKAESDARLQERHRVGRIDQEAMDVSSRATTRARR